MGLIIGSQQNPSPSSAGAVRYDKPQSLTSAQKETAQMNIGVQKIADFIINDLVSGGIGKVLSAEMGKYLKQLIDALTLGRFYGIFASDSELPTGSEAGFAYVGSGNPYSVYNYNGTWTDSGATIDNATDVVNNLYDGGTRKALSAEMGKVLLQEFASIVNVVTETGFHIVDENLNIGAKYDEDGLDFAKISEHAINILKQAGVGADIEYLADTEEPGFYVVDANLNVGLILDEDGIHAKNILEYEIIEN